MSQAVNTVCETARVVLGAANLVSAVDRTLHAPAPEDEFCNGMECALEAVAFLSNLFGVVGKAADFSDKTLHHIKSAEVAAHMVKLTPTLVRTSLQWSRGEIDAAEAIDQALITPTAGLVRVATECQIYQFRYLATLPDKDRFIEHPSRDGLCSKQFLTVEECKEYEKSAAKVLPYANIADIAAQVGVGKWTLKATAATYALMQGQIVPNVPQVAANIAQPGPNLANVQQDQTIVDLPVAAWGNIPACLHNDPIFSRFTCLITMEPIRDPVLDPNGITLYERSAILAWLRNHNTSPMTRQPLAPHQLKDATELKGLIDQRLGMYQAQLQQAIQQGLVQAAPLHLLQAAQQAHPGY